MIATPLLTLAPAIGNHVWQCTIFVIAVTVLTLSLRKNHPRVRYWLWLAASTKFLIPFSLLAVLGRHLAWSRGSGGAQAALYVAIDEVSQPFATPDMFHPTSAAPVAALANLTHALPVLFAVAWLCGFLVVLTLWCRRWRKVAAVISEAVPLREGREVQALRRLEFRAGIRSRIEMRLSKTSLEPGIFGIVCPMLLWPAGISDRLTDAHMEAILAHELRHVQRCDNLLATVHMLVEAIFWFHPLVWWLGARLVEERECACDQDVLELGSERQVYAESILKVCEFCLESPLACISGITHSDLKKRMVNIMTNGILCKLDFSRKLLLGVAGLAALALPILSGLLNVASSRAAAQVENSLPGAHVFESARIAQSRSGDMHSRLQITPTGSFIATNVTPKILIEYAYNLRLNQPEGHLSWIDAERYDIDAKMPVASAAAQRQANVDEPSQELRLELQALLKDRFKLAITGHTEQVPFYALTVAENGSKLHASSVPPDHVLRTLDSEIIAKGAPIRTLASALSGRLGRIVVDRTGLAGLYDFTLQWMPDEHGRLALGKDDLQTDSSESSLFTALQQQLGLKLEPRQGPVQNVVIDHMERPSQN